MSTTKVYSPPKPSMRVSTMRLLDQWLGVPACAALTVLRRGNDLIQGNVSAACRDEFCS